MRIYRLINKQTPRLTLCFGDTVRTFPLLFCDKTFEFAIQTWQTSLEHYYVYVQTYFLSQLCKMLILLISSHCKMCTLPTLRSRVFVCCEQYKHARLYCWQWTHFTMGPNEQNQHFAELRQKMFAHIRSSAPNMFAKFGWKTRKFCHKKVAKVIAKLESDRL